MLGARYADGPRDRIANALPVPADYGMGEVVGIKQANGLYFVAFVYKASARGMGHVERVVVSAVAPVGSRVEADQAGERQLDPSLRAPRAWQLERAIHPDLRRRRVGPIR